MVCRFAGVPQLKGLGMNHLQATVGPLHHRAAMLDSVSRVDIRDLFNLNDLWLVDVPANHTLASVTASKLA